MSITSLSLIISDQIQKTRNVQHVVDTMNKWELSAVQRVVTVYGIDGIPSWWVFSYGGSTQERDGTTLYSLGTVTRAEYTQYKERKATHV